MTRLPSLRIDAASLPEFVNYINNRTVGFDDLFSTFATAGKTGNYPPYNLVRTGEDTYEITMAIAGFKKTEVTVEVVDRELSITGQKAKDEGASDVDYLHQGLAMRDFQRSFKLVEYMEVKGATLEDGILTIRLARELPEAAKPKLITIS